MNNYSERIDEIINYAYEGEVDWIYNRLDGTSVMDKAIKGIKDDKAKTKQLITLLIKELVEEARIDELGHCCGKCGVWHSETCNISQRRLTFRERIAELRQYEKE